MKKKNLSLTKMKQTKLAFAVKATAAAGMKRGREESGASGGLSAALVEPQWKAALSEAFSGPGFTSAARYLEAEAQCGREFFPPRELVFSAFNYTPLSAVKVVIIGQDPYHDDGQAHGLCFSVQPGVKVPPSLVNMYKELSTDIAGFKTPKHGCLVPWARQGVLLLNATLTVEPHKANSHAKIGWQKFTDDVIRVLNDKTTGVVFLLWGNFAQDKGKIIDETKHRVVKCAHPSPLSASKWFGCKTFSKCNALLKELGKQPIDWSLPEEMKTLDGSS